MSTTISPCALPLITVDNGESKFLVHDEGLAVLKKCKSNIAIVAVAGLYRTGKSFLLNLLTAHASGFEVGSTIHACTKGIWIWSEPKFDQESGLYTVYIDTEGLGSTTRTSTHDSRIFALALLLSSYFIYNSRGVIDGQALEDLSLVANLTNIIRVKAGQSQENNSTLSEYFPTFLWVLRDFTLRLETENGDKLTSFQYLENCLSAQSGNSESIASKNRIRKFIRDYFPVRNCVTLVRPAEDEQILKDLSSVPLTSLRPEFQTQVSALLSMIQQGTKAKQFQGQIVSGDVLCTIIQSYADAINAGGVPVISSAWERVLSSRCREASEAAFGSYERSLQQYLLAKKKQMPKFGSEELGGDPVLGTASMSAETLLPVSDSVLQECHSKAREASEDLYWSQAKDKTSEASVASYSELRQVLEEKLAEMRRLNEVASQKATEKLIEMQLADIVFSPGTASRVSDDGFESEIGNVESMKQRLRRFETGVTDLLNTLVNEDRVGPCGPAAAVKLLSERALSELGGWAKSVADTYRGVEYSLQNRTDSSERSVADVRSRIATKEAVFAEQLKGVAWAVRELEGRIADEIQRHAEDVSRREAESSRYNVMIEDLVALHVATVRSMQLRQDELRSRLSEERDAVMREEKRLNDDTILLKSEAESVNERRQLERLNTQELVTKQEAHVASLRQKLVDLENEHRTNEELKKQESAKALGKATASYEQEAEALTKLLGEESRRDVEEKQRQIAKLDGLLRKKRGQIKELEDAGIKYVPEGTSSAVIASGVAGRNGSSSSIPSSGSSTVTTENEIVSGEREQGRIVINKKKVKQVYRSGSFRVPSSSSNK